MRYFLIISLVILYGCNSGIEDKSKRNENWCWWVDAKTGKVQWIPISTYTTVENGQYTLFYFSGVVYEKGKLVKGQKVDTVFKYDLKGAALRLYTFQY